jgi:predicted MFS family arabinose efflux permease
VHSIRAAQERLTSSTGFLGYVGKQLLEGAGSEGGERAGAASDGGERVHVASLLLNLGGAFLYMMNTYVVVPTADAYARALGAQATLCGLVVAAMAVSQLASSLYFSACSNASFSLPLRLGAGLLLLGNLLYALAFDLRSLPLLLLGRFLCG